MHRVWTRNLKIYELSSLLVFWKSPVNNGSTVIIHTIDWAKSCERLEVCLGAVLEVSWCHPVFLRTRGTDGPHPWDHSLDITDDPSSYLSVCIPFYKPGCVILISTGTIDSLHHMGWPLFHSRPINMVQHGPAWLLISQANFWSCECLL